MSEPLDVDAIKREHEHIKSISTGRDICTTDGHFWPCDAIRLVREIERLRADARERRAAVWDECWQAAGDYAAALISGNAPAEPQNPYREADQ